MDHSKPYIHMLSIPELGVKLLIFMSSGLQCFTVRLHVFSHTKPPPAETTLLLFFLHKQLKVRQIEVR